MADFLSREQAAYPDIAARYQTLKDLHTRNAMLAASPPPPPAMSLGGGIFTGHAHLFVPPTVHLPQLLLQGKLMRRDRTFLTWKWRDFYLERQRLQYFNERHVRKGEIVLTPTTPVVIRLLDEPKEFGFLLFVQHEKHTLAAATAHDRQKWIDAFVQHFHANVEDCQTKSTAHQEPLTKQDKRGKPTFVTIPDLSSDDEAASEAMTASPSSDPVEQPVDKEDVLQARLERCRLHTAGTELDLSGLRLECIPIEISTLFPTLRRLNLSKNALATLPHDFSRQFPQLVSLNLVQNELIELPEQFGTLRHLQKLRLARNRLEMLPPTFARLHNLEELDLSSNQIQELDDEIGYQLNKLNTLQLAHNRLKDIPDSFSNLGALRVVDLTGNDALETNGVPEKIRRLHERNIIVHSRSKRRELITRALRVRTAVKQLMAMHVPAQSSPKKNAGLADK
ncbi:hypothetical protein P43SY_000247 [Pythium insidiosum]|uniref:PH domain-containing protein n=1 Tax=Pythium insidiosum TaxID=114742 RepID=A0AAD5LP10_PYTIN|nr:hypothetical protein P43SY_000247 [Pythium insidiosum]